MQIIPIKSKDVRQVFKQHYGSIMRVNNITKKGYRAFLFENTPDDEGEAGNSKLVIDMLAKPEPGCRRIAYGTIRTINVEKPAIQYQISP